MSATHETATQLPEYRRVVIDENGKLAWLDPELGWMELTFLDQPQKTRPAPTLWRYAQGA